MGDFFVVKIMSGGQSASVVLALSNEIAVLQYPPAAASAVILLIIVTLMVAAILRIVDVRKELAGLRTAHRHAAPVMARRPWTFYALAAFFTLFVLFLYGPMFAIYILSFQGPSGGSDVSDAGLFLRLVLSARSGNSAREISQGAFRTLDRCSRCIVLTLTVVFSVMAGVAFRRRFVGSSIVFYMAIASLIMPGLLISLGIGLMFQFLGIQPNWYTSALGAQLTWTLPFGLLIMFAVFNRFNRSYEEAARDLERLDPADLPTCGPAHPAARHHRRRAVRIHLVL